jgi:hypothetical protein
MHWRSRRSLGQKVFSRPGAAAAKEEEVGWRESLYRVYKSGQQSMRVAVYGCKHDAATFEELLKGYCLFNPDETLGSAMIDAACLNMPKARLVAMCVPLFVPSLVFKAACEPATASVL